MLGLSVMHAWNTYMLNVNPYLSSDPLDLAVRTNRWNEGDRSGIYQEQINQEVHTLLL